MLANCYCAIFSAFWANRTLGLLFCEVYSGVKFQFSHKSLYPLEYLLRRVFLHHRFFYRETHHKSRFLWRKTRDSVPISLLSSPKWAPILVLWATRLRPAGTRQKFAVKIGISRKITVHVAIKVPRDFRLEAKILAEDMGLEEVRIVQTLKFQGGKAPSSGVVTFK